MYIHADAFTSLFNLLNTPGSLITQLNDEQKAARKKGLQLYNLGEYRESESYLMIAATAGDRDSQYALAQVIKEFKAYKNISDVFSQIAEMLSETDKEAGKAFAQEWKRTHPPMSEYRLTYSNPR